MSQTDDDVISNGKAEEKEASRFRQVLPQFVANSMANMVSLDLSLIMNYSTVLIADLHHATGDMSLDDRAASWVGSTAYFCQPLGSLFSGVLVETLGRKGGLLAVNIPYFVSWMLIYTAPSVSVLLAANVLIGVTVGLSEAPLVNYGGEMSQPHIRGTVTASGSIFYQLGMFAEYLMGSLTDWRTTALISSSVPIASFLVLLLLPETPQYLISKGRIKQAEKSLCWLRGWVKPGAIQNELNELVQNHHQHLASAGRELPPDAKDLPEADLLLSAEPPKRQNVLRRASNQVLELFQSHTLRPLMLLLPLFAAVNLTGFTSIRPYMVHVFESFRPAMDAKWVTVLSSLCNTVGSFFLIFTVKLVGKRRLCLIFTAGSLVSSLLLGTYAFFMHEATPKSWIPVFLFLSLALCSTVVGQFPWILLCEVFPFKTRGLASGVSAACAYLIVFATNRTYLAMEQTLQLYGSFWFFGLINCVGLVYMYFTLLETEGKTLQQIEEHFTKGLFFKPWQLFRK